MIRILLIRHGTTDLSGKVLYGRMPGVHLNDDGLRQAQQLGQALKGRYSLSEVVSSPLERAMQTAHCIANPQHLGVSVDEELSEIDFGSWMGKSFSDLHGSALWTRYNQLRSMTVPPGGESMMAVQARSWQAIERIIMRYSEISNAAVAVVTHGDVIRSLLVLLLGMSPDHLHRIEIAPASVTEISIRPGEPVITSINGRFDE
jgi:broad specificity phosphatase PhoE